MNLWKRFSIVKYQVTLVRRNSLHIYYLYYLLLQHVSPEINLIHHVILFCSVRSFVSLVRCLKSQGDLKPVENDGDDESYEEE